MALERRVRQRERQREREIVKQKHMTVFMQHTAAVCAVCLLVNFLVYMIKHNFVHICASVEVYVLE